MNPFQVGDRVKTAPNLATQRTGGRIKRTACYAATKGGGSTCNSKLCVHAPKDYCWTEWIVNGVSIGTFSYHYGELVLDNGPTAQASVSAPTNTSAVKPANVAGKTDLKDLVADLAVPVDKASLDAVAEEFTKTVREMAGAVPNKSAPADAHKFDFDAYNGFKNRDGTKRSWNK